MFEFNVRLVSALRAYFEGDERAIAAGQSEWINTSDPVVHGPLVKFWQENLTVEHARVLQTLERADQWFRFDVKDEEKSR